MFQSVGALGSRLKRRKHGRSGNVFSMKQIKEDIVNDFLLDGDFA